MKAPRHFQRCPSCGDTLLQLRLEGSNETVRVHIFCEVMFSIAVALALIHWYVWAAILVGLAALVGLVCWRPAALAHARKCMYVCTKCFVRYSYDELEGKEHAV
jgi:hypothetical protein